MKQLDKKTFLALWLFNPFISAIYVFRNFKENVHIAPYLLLSFFFGLSFVVSTTGGDSERYAAELVRYHQDSVSLVQVLDEAYGEGGSKLDIYQPFLTWFVSIFTENTKILFSIFAVVFGYFWFKTLIIIRSHINIPLKGIALLTFILLALTNPIWQINGVRMWTAVAVFFYGIVLIHLKKEKKGWFFLVLPVFIHFSLIASLGLYIAYTLLPSKNTTILLIIFIASFFLGQLDLNFVRETFALLPGMIQSKEAYLGEEYVEVLSEKKADHALHFLLAGILQKYIFFSMVIIIYYYGVFKRNLLDKNLKIFFPMALFFLSFSNIASSVPSGGRFAVLSNLILMTIFLLFLNYNVKLTRSINFLLRITMVFVIVFLIRTGMESVGPFFFIGNPILNWLIVDSPIIEFIKSPF
ncbi:EpsG family protein [Flavobacterium ardleyense]|uniref:EpsG family protein n=1 Tax=Flavobacterium ardleyense TaxID=2038737 RepID=UPI00298C94FA|nr:EpsG family protein [Flavobacterium ardleyense]